MLIKDFKTLIIIAVFLMHGNDGIAQDTAATFTITGVVKDKKTGQAIGYGSVGLKTAHIAAQINEAGAFRLKVPKAQMGFSLWVNAIGYQTDSLRLVPTQSRYTFFLKPSNSALNEVIVTGVSRATLARENAIPIVAVSAQKIERSAESNIIDVLVKNVPGLNAVKTGPNISKPFIRGLGYTRVLTLYDGIRQEGQQWGDEHGIEVDPYHIERAEVVKGPSSLIYGSDALAGVVGLIPYMPEQTDGHIKGKISSEYQSNNGLIGNGLNLTYGSLHWRYALNGAYRLAKNYQNSIDGRVYNTGFREANAGASLKYCNDKGYSSINFTLYDNHQGIPDGSRDSLSRQFSYQVNEGSLDDIMNRPIVSDKVLNAYEQSPLNQHIQHYRGYIKNHYRLAKGDIDAIVALQQNIRREYTHPTIPSQAGMYVRLNTLNYSANYHIPLTAHIDFSAGLNGMYQNNISKDATDFPIPNYTLFDMGLYSFAKWKKDKWTLAAGIRYDQRQLKGTDFYTMKDSTTGFEKQFNDEGSASAYLQFPSFAKTFRGLSLSLGSTYALNSQTSIKANIARGYRAPSIPEFSSNGLDPGAHIVYLGNRSFEPEFSLQEDLGIEVAKPNYSIGISIFNNNITNYIYLSQLLDANNNPIVDAQGNKTYQYQQSSAQLYGLEATFSLHLEQWRGFEFAHSLALSYGFNRAESFRGTQLMGEYLPMIPPLHYLSNISQEWKINARMLSAVYAKVEADVNGAQSRYLARNNTETYTPSYTLFNLSLGTTIQYTENSSLKLYFQVNNLFDKAYQSNLSRLKYFEYYTAAANGQKGIYNMGRNICLKAMLNF